MGSRQNSILSDDLGENRGGTTKNRKKAKPQMNLASGASENEDEEQKNEVGDTNEENIMIDQTNDLNNIYAFGDNAKFLVFNVGNMSWKF